MTNELTTTTINTINNNQILVPQPGSKDQVSRMSIFAAWLDDQSQNWSVPDLAAYRDYLLNDYQGKQGQPLSANSVASHIATIRGRYQIIMTDNSIRDTLYHLTPDNASAADRKSFVDEMLTRLENATAAHQSKVSITTKQDTPDNDHVRLTPSQANDLIAAPDITTSLKGLRDKALLCIMLATGIREQELVDLDVSDLRVKVDEELCLLVRHGKGNKQRAIPYGAFSGCLVVVDEWLNKAGILDGAVFRGFWKGNKGVRPNRLSVRQVNYILDNYPVVIDGERKTIHPHDLRRTYARLLYDTGVDMTAIRDNLGHADIRTTQTYVGQQNMSKRRPEKSVLNMML